MVKTDWPGVVAIKKPGGRVYYYFRTREGGKARMIRMPDDPKSEAFSRRYRELTAPEKARPAALVHSFDELIASYKASSRFNQISDRTKRDYLRYLDKIGAWLHSANAAKYPRSEVIRMRDESAGKPRTANYYVSVMSLLMEHAIDLGWRTDNPAKGVKKLRTGPGYRPWTAVEIDKFRESADPTSRMIFELALGTGQRPGDLVSMRWSDYDGSTIRVTQSKTGRELWIPPSDTLSRHLKAAKRDAQGLTILTKAGGRPYTYFGIAQRIAKACKAAGIEGVSLHGLRKNATVELAEAGCSNAEIKAITGHTTDAMVAHYAQAARQKSLAQTARDRTSGKPSGKLGE